MADPELLEFARYRHLREWRDPATSRRWPDFCALSTEPLEPEEIQGVLPDGCTIPDGEMPNLDAEQAWTVVWYLGNQYWQVPDFIEKCDSCGDLYDSEREGAFREADEFPGQPAGHRCEACADEFFDL